VQVREEFVSTYTDGRTTSLREMTTQEYDRMCDAMDASLDARSHLRARRSTALNVMQRLGIDTTDWMRINAFCADKRIAGKEFGRLSIQELDALTVKMRAIMRNGGLRAFAPTQTKQVVCVPLDINSAMAN
jgi:hypothetical protein